MPKSYSLDLRKRILKNYDDGTPIEDLVKQFDVSRSTVYSYIKQQRETGNIASKVYRPGPKLKLAPHETKVRQLVADHPDATLAEYCEMLSEHVVVSTTTLCDFFHYLKITRKKRLSTLPNNTAKMS
jgi:transposase